MGAAGPVDANTAEGAAGEETRAAAGGPDATTADATTGNATTDNTPATPDERTALDGSAAKSNTATEETRPTAGGPAAATTGNATTDNTPATPDERTALGGSAAESNTATEREAAEPEAAETEADQAETEPAEAEAEAAEPEATPAEARPAWRRLPVLLLAAAVLLTGAGVWFTLEARSAAANPAAANRALTDVAATADVTSAVTLAVNRIFSYSYDRTDVTEKAAAAVLRGSAKDSYEKLFAEVRRKAPEQKLVLTSRVSAIAVQELENGHARLLVFLDQSAVRADNNATDSAAAQLSVTAEHTNGGWVVTELEPR
ncbi:hypothetical protein HUT10_18295 [Amycolatopsis sp. Hca4]|nr:hypothetical protein HUT10_18295 [Amycolatopsis sp. Hca4]